MAEWLQMAHRDGAGYMLAGLIGARTTVAKKGEVSPDCMFFVTSTFFRASPIGSSFQTLFGMIMTVLIALEFNHTIMPALQRKRSIIRLRVVVLIALLALVRSFVILDASQSEPLTIIGLASAVLALGVVLWLVRDQERKQAD
jgi:uncharacterized membrane protein (DUF373 family)